MSTEGNRLLAAHDAAVEALNRATDRGLDYVKLDALHLYTLLDGLYAVLGMLPAGQGPHRVPDDTTTEPTPTV